MKRIIVISLILFLSVILFFNPKDFVVSKNEDIVLGQSCALSGPAGALGTAFTQGANVYFDEVNNNGGVNGRKIKLITMDDYYEPDYAVENTLELINNKNVFAMFGEIGTPTSKAVIPIISEKKVPFLMPFSGAKLLREPYNKYIINMRSSYAKESSAIVEYLVNVKKQTKIAIFYQNDSYGKSGLDGVLKALKAKNMTLVAHGKYRRNTLLIESALKNIVEKKPDAVIMIGAYKPCSIFIKEAKKRGLKNTIFANISFVGSEALVKALDKKTDNLIISQVVPLAKSINNPKIKNFTSLEGYLAAKLFVKAMENTKEPLTRDSFLDSFKTLSSSSLGDDLFLKIDNNKFIGLNKVYITKYENSEFIQVLEYK